MRDTGLRLAVLLVLGLATYATIWASRRIIEKQRSRALELDPIPELAEFAEEDMSVRVRILAFSREDCRLCHTMQAPVLRRMQEAYGDTLAIATVDAPSSPVLMQRYHVLTVPTTVLFDVSGKVHAINYGFTNAQSLSRQVEEILALDGLQEALS